MTVARNYEGQGGGLTIDITGQVGTAIGEVLNPEGVDVTITQAWLEIITASTAGCNLSCGIEATGVTATDLWNAGAVDGLTAGSLSNCFAPQDTAETELTDPVDWGAAQYITFTGSASSVGLSARLHVTYTRQSA